MADTIADFIREDLARRRKADVGAANLSLSMAADQNPDQFAGDLTLAQDFERTTGNAVPPVMVGPEYRSVFQNVINAAKNQTILSSSPTLTEFVRDPQNAALAKDDLGGLSRLETLLGATANSFKRAMISVPHTYEQFMASSYAGDAADLKRSFGDILFDERQPILNKDGKEVDRVWAGPGDVLGAAWRWGTSRWTGVVDAVAGTDASQTAAGYQMRADALRRRIAGLSMSPGAQVVRDKMGTIKGTWQDQLSQFGKIVADDPIGFMSFVGQVSAESLPAMGVATGVGVVTRNPTAAAATMGALSGVREYGSSAGDIIAQSGYDLTTPEGALAAISDENLMRKAANVGQTRALIIGVLDGLSGGVAGKVLSESHVGNMVLQSLSQAVFGAGGEAAAQYASGQPMSLSDILMEGIAEFASAPVEVTGMAVSKVREASSKAKAAQNRVSLFQELSGQAVNSKLRARMPDRFRQFVDQATANGPVENVFVPADQFVQYFQGNGIDPMALVDQLDGVSRDDLNAALAAGGDLRIPTSTYAAKIAGSEHDAFMMENMRFNPTDMTAREAADFNAHVDDIMQQMWAEAEDIRQEDERWRAVEDKIHDQVVSQMRAAGLSTERAMAEVQPVVAFYRTRAARMGLTTEEYLAKHPLPKIEGSIPDGMQFKNVDELNRLLAEARSAKAPDADRRQSLLEFIDNYGGISDPGGELKARDAAVIKRGKGKKTLNLLRDTGNAGQGSMLGPSQGGKRHGVDDVAQAAIDAGFMADHPVVQEYKAAMADGGQVPDITRALWDAVDAELQGNKQVSEQDAAPVDTSHLDQIEQYLNGLGLDLSNSDEEIRAAIEKDQAAPDRKYAQDDPNAQRNLPVQFNGDVELAPVMIGGERGLTMAEATAAWKGFKGEKVALASGEPVALNRANKAIHSWMHGGMNRSDLIPHLPEIVSGAVAYASAPDTANPDRSYVNAVAHIVMDGKDMSVRLMLHDIGDGTLRQYQIEGFDVTATPQAISGLEPRKVRGEAAATNLTVAEAVSGFKPELRLFQRGDASPLDVLLASVRENMARKDKLTADLADAGKPVLFAAADGSRAMAGPDMSKSGGFRLTYLGQDGKPSGHSEFASLGAAIRRALDERFDPVGATYQQAQEQDQPLYVVHNLSAEKLRHAAALGGLAAPSLAVARGDIGFNSFGEISLIGAPSLADPKTKGVRLFNADVYSPRQPRARFKVDAKAARAMNAVIAPVAEKLGLEFDGVRADEIERDGMSALTEQMAVKAAWLKDHGQDVPVVREAPDEPMPVNGMSMFTETNAADLANNPAFIDRLKRKYELNVKKHEGNDALLARIKEAWLNDDGEISDDMIRNWSNDVAARNREIAAFRAKPQGEGRISRYLTSKAIDEAIGARIGDFNAWVREKFGGVVTDMFFENEAGRKKEYTLTNLVREMTRMIRNGENWNYGAGNVRAAVAPEFKALSEVKDARGQITSDKAMEDLKDEVNNELFALADKFAPYAGSMAKGFGWGDTFSEFLRDIAKGPRAVAQWDFAAKVPAELMDEARTFLEKLKGLPTNYFEIKMQRSMDLGEFTAALVPSNLAADARKILTDAGLELVEYQNGDDGGVARNAALQQVGPRVFFQDSSAPRGMIQFGSDGQSLIRLFETANLSTMQHELGHMFLTMIQSDAAGGDQGSVADLETVKTWWRANAADVAADGNKAFPEAGITAEDVQRAIDTGTTGDLMKDAAIDVGMQEQWARGYEAYLMEGKSPSVEMQGVFAKMRAWMISVYKMLRGLNVNITPEIRQVFDRMLATDDEIAKAKRSTGDGGAVFATADQMGLTPEEFDRFMKLRAQAEDEAKARLQREIMEPIKRQKEEWFKAEKVKAEAEVTRQVNAMPVFRALEWLGNRRWLGDGKPEAMPDMRLSRDILVERYGEGVLKTLPRGKFTLYANEGGMNPDDVAGWFGFDSGDQMVKAMERAPKRLDAIRDETARLMNERHGDALNDGEIEKIALDAVHTDRRGEWIAAELKAVAEVAGVDVKLTMKEARATARQTVARMKVRDATASMRYLAAERKAAEEAARLGATLAREKVWLDAARRRVESQARKAAAGKVAPDTVATAVNAFNDKFETTTSTFTVAEQNRTTKDGRAYTIPGGERTTTSLGHNDLVQKLIDAKRRQLMNHALFMEARAVADEVSSAERYVQRLNKASMREKIAGAGRRENAQMDYLAAIDEILDRYDFRKLSARAEQRRGALVAFVEAMKAAGRENELAVPEAVLRDASMKPYKTLTVEELRGVVDSLKNLQHIATRWNDLIDAKNQRKLDEAVSEIAAAFDQNMPKNPPGRVKTKGEARRGGVRKFLDLVLNSTTILREIDGFKDMGAAYRNLKSPIDQAMDRLTIRKEKAAEDMSNLYSVYSKTDRRKMAVREFIPALGYSLSKWERIAVALNTGNEGNYQRLTDPNVRGSLTEGQVKAVLSTLDERDANFIQSVWDYVGSFRDDIAARERRTTGVEPQWVEASSVEIGGKTLKGGYYPLKYDPRLSSLARDDEAQSIAESLQAGRFGKAQTRRGHLEARAKSSGRDVELDMSVLHRHVNQVIYDLELSEAVANSWKVLQNSQVRGAFMDAGRQADFDALEVWLKDVAEGQMAAGDWINAASRRAKSNFTAAKLAFNLATVASQVAGVSQTMVVVGKKDFLRGLQASFRKGVADEIAAKSPFMAERRTTFNKDISDFYNDPALGPTASRWGDIKREWVGPASFWLMTKVQWLLVDIPTWMAGYHQGLAQFGNDEAKAIAHADDIVKRAQGSGLFADRSAIERGSLSSKHRQSDVVRLYTTLGSYMFAKFNVAYERAMKGGKVIRQEGMSLRSVQEAASMALDMAFLFTLEAVVLAAIKARLPGDDDEDGWVLDDWAKFLATETAFSVLGTMPFVRDAASAVQGFDGGGAYGGIISEIAKPFTEIANGHVGKGLLKSIINNTGLFFGIPATTQINRAVDGVTGYATGDMSPLEALKVSTMGK